MKKNNPLTLEELSKKVPVVEFYTPIKCGYVLEFEWAGDLVLTRYEDSEEVDEKKKKVEMSVMDKDFDGFIKSLRKLIGRANLYICKPCALLWLSVANGGDPQDYDTV